MKGHRSRGKAKRIVVAGHGRCIRGTRLFGAAAPSVVRTAKEKQAARSRRAVVKMTPLGLLGRAARAVREKVAAALGARRLAASAENKDAAESR